MDETETKARVARKAEDETEVIIESVRVLSKRTEVMDNGDQFAKPAEELKQLDGNSPVIKRRMTNEIKKFQRGQDGAESKQIQEKDFIDGYHSYDVVEPPYNLEYLAKLYELSSPHYAAVNAKVANIVGLGYNLVENNKSKRNFERMADNQDKVKRERRRLDEHKDNLVQSLEKMNEEDTFVEVLTKVWRDYEVTGNGYIEIGRKKDGSIGYLGHIPAQTIRIRKKRDGFVQMSGFQVQFFAHYGAGFDKEGKPQTIPNPVGGGKPNEVIHIKKYSPTSGYYGVPDIVAAIRAVAGNKAAEQFNLDYFENKAVPRYAIILKGAKLGSRAEQDLLGFFETSLRGQNHRSIYIPLPGDTPDNKVELELKAIEAGIQDASFTKYRAANLSDILMAHRVPVTKVSVSEGASLAIAKDADKTFKEQVCGPEQRIFEKKVQKFIGEMTDALDFKLNEMTLTDENTQSQIDERRRKTGTETANEQRLRRGQPAIEGGDELFDMNAQQKIAEMSDATARRGQDKQAEAKATAASGGQSPVTNRERDATRSANATDSAGEARNPKGEGRSTP